MIYCACDATRLERLDRELTTFVDTLTADFGRPERRAAMAHYITGLLLDGERKSIEPIAARLVDRPDQIQAMRQRLQQCVVVSPWEAAELFARVACMLDRELPEVTALVVDDTGFPKKGRHSAGVARQYSGTLGRTDNCQMATSLHLAGERGSGMHWHAALFARELDDGSRTLSGSGRSGHGVVCAEMAACA